MRYAETWPLYRDWWDRMAIKPERMAEFNNIASFAISHKVTYLQIEQATGLPWTMVAVIHRRESDANFNTYLGNGQSLARRTTEVPAGRGPFRSFLEGAVDAVKVEGWGSIKDWRLEKMLYYTMLFNGTGYGANSPYVWGGTNIQKRGKYIRDHVYNPLAWDPQPGTAPIFWMLAKLDSTVKFTRED